MRMPIKPKTSRLDTKNTPSVTDPALAEIKHLFNADLGIHSLMSEYIVRPMSYSVFWQFWGDKDYRTFVLVPPQAVYGFVEVLGSGYNTTITVTSRELDDTQRGSATVHYIQGSEGTDDDTQVTDETTFVQYHLKKSTWVNSSEPLQFRSFTSWDPHPMAIKFQSTAPAYATVVAFCIHWIYRNV